jgi:hypothetical protein
MSKNISDRELKKFRSKDGSDDTKIATVIEQDEPVKVETSGVEWDTIETTFPNNHQDLFTYKLNSSIVQTVLVTYDSNNKKTIILVQKTRY